MTFFPPSIPTRELVEIQYQADRRGLKLGPRIWWIERQMFWHWLRLIAKTMR